MKLIKCEIKKIPTKEDNSDISRKLLLKELNVHLHHWENVKMDEKKLTIILNFLI